MTASNMAQVGFPGQKDFVRMGPHERQIYNNLILWIFQTVTSAKSLSYSKI